MNQAACRSDNPTPENVRERAELFFPGRTRGPGSEKKMRRAAIAAKAICETCPVAKACEDYRSKLAINYGIWAGVAETEREHGGAA
jgi:hypothetical protein